MHCICYLGPGFTLKLLLAGGGYTYPSGGLHTDVDGRLLSASALPGWRVTSDGISIAVYAGPIVQDYRLSPYDPGSLLHGFYSGAQLAADVWYQPTPTSMVALNGTIASIAAIGTMRAAVGWQFSEPFFVGPEAQALWCIDYQQWRLGAHVTGYRIDGLDWSAAAGWTLNLFAASVPICALASTPVLSPGRHLNPASGGNASPRLSWRMPSIPRAPACRIAGRRASSP